jgi:hypothetical protein
MAELSHKDLGLCETPSIPLYILWYQIIFHRPEKSSTLMFGVAPYNPDLENDSSGNSLCA